MTKQAPHQKQDLSNQQDGPRELASSTRNLPRPSLNVQGDSLWGEHAASTTTSIAVDPVALINTECITVTSAMRKHSRWAHSSVSAILGGGVSPSYRHSPRPSSTRDKENSARKKSNGALEKDATVVSDDDSLANRWGLRGKRGKSLQDHPLMSAFARLRSDLRGCAGQLDGVPFLCKSL